MTRFVSMPISLAMVGSAAVARIARPVRDLPTKICRPIIRATATATVKMAT